ncbi:MAG: TadE/TadG family type IV pilus assembly protein [Bacillota bacterium]
MLLRRSRSGQATVEMALVLPVLLLVLFGIVESGRLVHAHLLLQHATREGVRLGITGATDLEIEQRVRYAAATLDQSRLSIFITPPQGQRHRGGDLTVVLNYTFVTVYPLIPGWPAPVPIRASLAMRMD